MPEAPTLRARLTGVLGLALLLLGLLASPAAAHAELVSTIPVTGAQLTSVDQVTLQFTEPVQILPSAVTLLDADGTKVAVGAPRVEGNDVVVPLDGLAEGGYVVAWRVVSLDGHPIQGSFTFGLGAAAPTAALAAGRSPAFATARTAVVATEILAVLFLAGAWLARKVVLPRGPARTRADQLLRIAAVVGLAATAVLVPVRGAELLGVAPLATFAPGNLIALAGTTVGRAAILRALALSAFLLRGRTRRHEPAVGWVSAMLALGSFALDGHTRTVDAPLLGAISDVVHLAAGAAWVGGLVILADALRPARRPDAIGVARMVGRFSLVATIAVAAVTVTGSLLAGQILPAGLALGASSYATALVAKTSLVALLVAFGAYNHVALVPMVARASRPLVAGGSVHALPAPLVVRRRRAVRDASALGSLRRTLRVEAALFLAVATLTAGLVELSPPPPVTATDVQAYVDLGGGLSANFEATVDPRGGDRVLVRLINPVGQPGKAESVALLAGSEALGIGATEWDLVAAGPGLWSLDADLLPLAGRWELTLVARTSRFAQESTGLHLDVPAA